MSFVLKNFLTLEPLGKMGATGESVLGQEEAVVASIRSVMQDLQTSIQELCKASLAKINTLGKHFLSSPLLSLSSPLLSSPLLSSPFLQTVKTSLVFVVNHVPVASTPSGAVAGATETDNCGQDKSQNTGTETLNHAVYCLLCVFKKRTPDVLLTTHPLVSVVYEMMTDLPPLPPPRPQGRLL